MAASWYSWLLPSQYFEPLWGLALLALVCVVVVVVVVVIGGGGGGGRCLQLVRDPNSGICGLLAEGLHLAQVQRLLRQLACSRAREDRRLVSTWRPVSLVSVLSHLRTCRLIGSERHHCSRILLAAKPQCVAAKAFKPHAPLTHAAIHV